MSQAANASFSLSQQYLLRLNIQNVFITFRPTTEISCISFIRKCAAEIRDNLFYSIFSA